MQQDLLNEPFETEATELGDLIMRIVRDEDNDELWREFYNIFANTPFWVPVERVSAPNSDEETQFVLDKQRDGTRNLIIFESEKRLQENHETYLKERQVNVDMAQMSGFEIVCSFSDEMFSGGGLWIDFGKATKFVLECDTVKYLREELKTV